MKEETVLILRQSFYIYKKFYLLNGNVSRET